jgi:hypothetical protein
MNTYEVTLTSGIKRIEFAHCAEAAGRYAAAQSCVFGDRVAAVKFLHEGD